MEIFLFVYHMLAWSITVAVLQPVMIPWAWLAYKIWHGNKPINEDLIEAMWLRATLASLTLTVVAVGFLLCDWATIHWFDLQQNAGPIHIVYYIAFLALTARMMMYFFSMEDFFQGLSMTVIYFYLPVFALYLLTFLFRNPLQDYCLTWLAAPPKM